MNRIKIWQEAGSLKWFIEIDGLMDTRQLFETEELAEAFIINRLLGD